MHIQKVTRYLIASIWLINGVFCKILRLAPRHQLIVARICGDDHARALTCLIGTGEVLMTIWIVSGIYRRLNIVTQIVVIAIMNITEFIYASDLLMFGKINALLATLLIFVIWFNQLKSPQKEQLEH